MKLIDMPLQFTAVEVNYFKNVLQKFERNLKPLDTKSSNLINKRMVFNFEKTSFIDRSGLVGLCQITNLAKNSKIDLIFSNFSPEVKKVISLLGLDQVYPIAD